MTTVFKFQWLSGNIILWRLTPLYGFNPFTRVKEHTLDLVIQFKVVFIHMVIHSLKEILRHQFELHKSFWSTVLKSQTDELTQGKNAPLRSTDLERSIVKVKVKRS